MPAGEHDQASDGEQRADTGGQPREDTDQGAQPEREQHPNDGEGAGEPGGEGRSGSQPAGHPRQCTYPAARGVVCGVDGVGQVGGQHGEPARVDRGEHSRAEGQCQQRADHAPTLPSSARMVSAPGSTARNAVLPEVSKTTTVDTWVAW